MVMTVDEARRVHAGRQGLLHARDGSIAELVAATGWIRTVGGVEPYLAIRARRPGVTVAQIDAAVAARDLQIVPTVRGCMYVVPRDDVGLCLRTSAMLARRRLDRDCEKAGVGPGERERIADAVMAALASGPATTRAIGAALPDGVVRSLGPVGKKVGMSTALPAALRVLEWEGRVVRRPIDDRIDHERYTWALAAGDPLAGAALDSDEAVVRALTARFFDWTGFSTLDQLAAWTGVSKTHARRATRDLVEVAVDGVDEPFVAPDVPAVPSGSGRLVAVPALDNLTGLHGSAVLFADPADRDRPIACFGRPPLAALRDARHVFERLLVVDGRIVGAWTVDPDTLSAQAFAWDSAWQGPADREAQALTEFLAPLGHAKTFSLDSDDSMRRRIERLRAGVT